MARPSLRFHLEQLDALREDARTREQDLTLNLVYKQGRWWVAMDQALLSAISGGIAG